MRSLSVITFELVLDVYIFYADQALVQSKLDEDVILRLPKECGSLPSKMVRLNKSVYGLKKVSHPWHEYLTSCVQTLDFQ